MKRFPTISKDVWAFTHDWKPWQRILMCPLLISPIVYLLATLLACISVNSHWHLLTKFGTDFRDEVALTFVIGLTLVNRHWFWIGMAWTALFGVLQLAMALPYGFGFFIQSTISLNVRILILMFLLGPISALNAEYKPKVKTYSLD